MIKTATVRFENDYGKSKEYVYLTADETLQKGDLVVVEARDWYQVATFERYSKSKNASKFIVQQVDLEELNQKKEQIQVLDDLMTEMEVRAKEINEMSRLESLAKKDNTMRELLTEFKNIKNEGDE